jgi:hypothetical protein
MAKKIKKKKTNSRDRAERSIFSLKGISFRTDTAFRNDMNRAHIKVSYYIISGRLNLQTSQVKNGSKNTVT